MDWTRFNPHGDAPDTAFEAFTGILFERSCRREFGTAVEHVRFVNGAGGDGGVEAYATCANGDVIGLQAKWFRTSLQDSHLQQVKDSLTTAIGIRPRLSRYVVAVPRDLADPKTSKRVTTTEQDRWDQLTDWAAARYPSVRIELWGDTALERLLAELGNDGLSGYWFANSELRIENLRLRFERAKSGWLSLRYAADIHHAGALQRDLQLRLNGISNSRGWRVEAGELLQILRAALTEGMRLTRYPEHVARADATEIWNAAERWLAAAIDRQQQIVRAVGEGAPFPLSLPVGEEPSDEAIRRLGGAVVELTEAAKGDSSLSPFEPIQEAITAVLDSQPRRVELVRSLRRLGQPVMYSGGPGFGKTHAMANAVELCLGAGNPALLIRARDIGPQAGWDDILRGAVGEPAWALEHILDALEAAAVRAEVKQAALRGDGLPSPTTRALVAVDGLDESTRADRWAERVGELEPLARRWPRILFAMTVRSGLESRMRHIPGIHRARLRGLSDAPLNEVFQAHCRESRISCPPRLRWALRTPLAIRLFAELYRGQEISTLPPSMLSLNQLMKKKLEHAESSAREADPVGWDHSLRPVRSILRAIVRAYVARGRPLTDQDAIAAVEAEPTIKGVLARDRWLAVLHHLRESGLLLETKRAAPDPIDDDVSTWEPAVETLTDYLLARETVQLVGNDTTSRMPEYLQHRYDAQALIVSMLGSDGHRFLESGLWAQDLSMPERESLQLRAIVDMTTDVAHGFEDWVRRLLVRDMPTCRKVIRCLVEPGLRLDGFSFGARFVHEVLLPLSVADRDLFWSGPAFVPSNHGGIWEGKGLHTHEELQLSPDDPWESAPWLMAWFTTTVDNRNRRRVRAELARWGAKNPAGLLELLKATTKSNDPQMREDLLSSTLGAACLARPDAAWLPLCDWVTVAFLDPAAPSYTEDLVVRHSARGLVERARICGCPIGGQPFASAAAASPVTGQLLPIDRAAATEVDPHHGYEPATGDLAWYVVPNATKPFFENERLARTGRHSDTSLDDVPDETLRLLVQGRLRPSASDETKNKADTELAARAAEKERAAKARENREELERRLEELGESLPEDDPEFQQLNGEWWATLSEEEQVTYERLAAEAEARSAVELGDADGSASEAELAATTTPTSTGGPPAPRPEYASVSEEAARLLDAHAAANGFAKLTPQQFAFGFVAAHAASLGWSKERFYGSPNGGKPGEILAPDIAIIRQYHEARHGERSQWPASQRSTSGSPSTCWQVIWRIAFLFTSSP